MLDYSAHYPLVVIVECNFLFLALAQGRIRSPYSSHDKMKVPSGTGNYCPCNHPCVANDTYIHLSLLSHHCHRSGRSFS